MNKKSIVAIIAFAVTFGSSAFLMSFFASPVRDVRVVQIKESSATRDKILRLLEQDIRNGEQRSTQAAFYGYGSESAADFTRYASAVNTYADLSGALDDSDLPRDFQKAWRKHMKAWRDKADMLKYDRFDAERADRLSQHSLAELYELKGEEIDSTWYEVLGIAGKYGAFPKNAYR